jgi:hypothetical protein
VIKINPRHYDSLTREERRELRLKYIDAQLGNCWYCNGSLFEPSKHEISQKPLNKWRFPKGFFKYSIHLHHDRFTGLTIGAVHAYCNAVSFDYDESPLLKKPTMREVEVA